jgi:hypothetical protein
MQDNRDDEEPNSLRFVITPAKKSSIHGLLLRILDGGAGVAAPDAGYRYPEVAAYNSKGARRVIEVTDTDDEAQQRASAIDDDFRTLTIEEWCDRYGIPLSFVTE